MSSLLVWVAIAAFLMVPALVWRFFRIRLLKIGVVAFWICPWIYLAAFDLVLANCASVPTSVFGDVLDCPTNWQTQFYELFRFFPQLIVASPLFGGPNILLWLLLSPLAIGTLIEVASRRLRNR